MSLNINEEIYIDEIRLDFFPLLLQFIEATHC